MVKLERLGVPSVLIVAKYFERDAKFNAESEGLTELGLVSLPTAAVPPRERIEKLNLGASLANDIIECFRKRAMPSRRESEDVAEEELVFAGETQAEAIEQMERFFLANCWSDGLPMVPPTREAVDRMLMGTDLPPEHSLGAVMPEGGEATVEKIAVNAVMAGCRPHYMPVIIAAVEAILDPRFDLLGVQCTAGMVGPLFIVSGQKIIEELNINYSFSAVGPGWRANSTIGRAVRLIMINLGRCWPGKPDMKAIGSPFKFNILIGENEAAYGGHWEPIRVAEGFPYEETTVSAYPAVTWQVEYMPPEVSTTERIVELLAGQARVKYDKHVMNWGMDNLVLISPTAFEAIKRGGHSREQFQRFMYEAVLTSCREFFAGHEPSTDGFAIPIPEDLVAQCKRSADAAVHLLKGPESLKAVVTGAPGPAMLTYVSTWGWGQSYFVQKPVRLPVRWEELLKREKGWESPIIK